MKYFRMSYEEIVFRRSYTNIILLNRSIPSYDYDNDEDRGRDGKKKSGNHNSSQYKHESELFTAMM